MNGLGTVLSHQMESNMYYKRVLTDRTTNFKKQLANPFSEQADEIIKDTYIFNFVPNAKKFRDIVLEDVFIQ